MSKTVKEIKASKSQLESDILDMLIRFEKDNEIRVDYVNVNSDRYDETEKGKKLTRKLICRNKGVIDVTINVNIENDPRSVDRVG